MKDKLYTEYKDVVSYITIENGELFIDINEERIGIKDFLMVMNSLIAEYINTTEEILNKQAENTKSKGK